MYGLGGPRELNESLAVIQISKGKWSLCILNKSDNADVFPSSSKTLMGPKRNLEKIFWTYLPSLQFPAIENGRFILTDLWKRLHFRIGNSKNVRQKDNLESCIGT